PTTCITNNTAETINNKLNFMFIFLSRFSCAVNIAKGYRLFPAKQVPDFALAARGNFDWIVFHRSVRVCANSQHEFRGEIFGSLRPRLLWAGDAGARLPNNPEADQSADCSSESPAQSRCGILRRRLAPHRGDAFRSAIQWRGLGGGA